MFQKGSILRILRRMEPFLARFDGEAHRSAFSTIDIHFAKGGDQNDIDAVQQEVSTCNRGSFDGLIDRARSDRLYFRPSMFPNHTRNRTGYSR